MQSIGMKSASIALERTVCVCNVVKVILILKIVQQRKELLHHSSNIKRHEYSPNKKTGDAEVQR
jgi:hypothetical protein